MAYQGKFSQNKNPEETIQLSAEIPAEETPVVAVSETQEAPKPVKKQAPKKAPGNKGGKKKKKKKKKKKANRTVTIIFYTCYFVLVAALLAGIFFLRSWLFN